MSCCSHTCSQGRDCPVRKQTPGTHYCEKSRQPCATPYQCSTDCKLINANSDGGDHPHQPAPRISKAEHLARWLVITTACGFALAAVAGFFKQG